MGKLKKEIKYISLSNVVPETWKEDAVDPHSNLTAQMQAWTFFSKLKIYRKHQIAMKATSTRLEVLQIFLFQVLKNLQFQLLQILNMQASLPLSIFAVKVL